MITNLSIAQAQQSTVIIINVTYKFLKRKLKMNSENEKML